MTGLGQVGALGRLGAPASARGGWWLSGSALDLDFANNQAFNRSTGFNGSPNGILTYTSPSPKLVYGDDGALKYAPHNRFLYSEDLSAASWSKIRGSATADKFSCDSTADANHSFQQNVTTVGVAAVLTVELKPAEITTVFIQLGGTIIRAVNLSTGVMGSYSLGTSTASLVAAEDGYYLLTLFGVPSNTNLTFFAGEGDGSTLDITLAGVRTGEGFYARKLQVSYGTVAFDYIPTTSAAIYALPVDHDPVTFEPLGVLIAEQRTNLLTYSEQFDNAAWLTANLVTMAAGTGTAPDGTNTAEVVKPNGSAAMHAIYQASTTVVSGTTYALSLYAKANGYNYVALMYHDGASTAGHETIQLFDLANGIVSSSYNTAPDSATIQSVGNGWYRCTITKSWATTSGNVSICPMNIDANPRGSLFAGDTTSGIYLWGAQLEAGAFATSYIPTVASQVTRAADQVGIATSAFAYNAAEGTLVAEFKGTPGIAQDIVWLANGLAESIAIYVNASLQALVWCRDGGVTQAAQPLPGSITGVDKVAYAFAANDFTGSLNGASVATDTSGTMPTPTELKLNPRTVASATGNVHIKRLTYFSTRKTNAELQALSA